MLVGLFMSVMFASTGVRQASIFNYEQLAQKHLFVHLEVTLHSVYLYSCIYTATKAPLYLEQKLHTYILCYADLVWMIMSLGGN